MHKKIKRTFPAFVTSLPLGGQTGLKIDLQAIR
jgi:hypothetical protein